MSCSTHVLGSPYTSIASTPFLQQAAATMSARRETGMRREAARAAATSGELQQHQVALAAIDSRSAPIGAVRLCLLLLAEIFKARREATSLSEPRSLGHGGRVHGRRREGERQIAEMSKQQQLHLHLFLRKTSSEDITLDWRNWLHCTPPIAVDRVRHGRFSSFLLVSPCFSSFPGQTYPLLFFLCHSCTRRVQGANEARELVQAASSAGL